MQFFCVNESKIRWMVLEKKFIKDICKNFHKKWEAQNQKFGFKNHKFGFKILEEIIKIEKKICNFLV